MGGALSQSGSEKSIRHLNARMLLPRGSKHQLLPRLKKKNWAARKNGFFCGQRSRRRGGRNNGFFFAPCEKAQSHNFQRLATLAVCMKVLCRPLQMPVDTFIFKVSTAKSGRQHFHFQSVDRYKWPSTLSFCVALKLQTINLKFACRPLFRANR